MYQILTPDNNFVRFDNWEPENHCIFGQRGFCLPVYAGTDVAFQFTVQADTVEEADALCQFDSSGIQAGLVADCDQAEFDLEFTQSPQRYRISSTQVLYYWPNFNGFEGAFEIDECFYFKVVIGEQSFCTNCFQRIGNDCFTSVIDFENEDNAFGFNYCAASEVQSGDLTSCDPYVVEFINQETLIIPYTSQLKTQFGDVPSVQAWIYDGPELTNVGIQITFTGTPPNITAINFDFGGLASGFIKIR